MKLLLRVGIHNLKKDGIFFNAIASVIVNVHFFIMSCT
jgi:hypothetical protein